MEVKSNLKDEVGDYIEPWRDQENERISLDLIFEQSGKVNLSRLETDPEFKG